MKIIMLIIIKNEKKKNDDGEEWKKKELTYGKANLNYLFANIYKTFFKEINSSFIY